MLERVLVVVQCSSSSFFLKNICNQPELCHFKPLSLNLFNQITVQKNFTTKKSDKNTLAVYNFETPTMTASFRDVN